MCFLPETCRHSGWKPSTCTLGLAPNGLQDGQADRQKMPRPADRNTILHSWLFCGQFVNMESALRCIKLSGLTSVLLHDSAIFLFHQHNRKIFFTWNPKPKCRDTWVAQRLSVCLRPRAWSWGPGIKYHIRLPAWSLLLPLPVSLPLLLSLCVSHE